MDHVAYVVYRHLGDDVSTPWVAICTCGAYGAGQTETDALQKIENHAAEMKRQESTTAA